MKRIPIGRMPLFSNDAEKIIATLSAYKISHIVSHLNFFKPSLRYPNRLDRIKSNVLRALCDRYPNVWPGLPEIAKKAKCSTAQARRVLRELELKDRLIVDINSRLTWRWPITQEIEKGHPTHVRILQSDDAGKAGGSGKDTVQYVICDRRIHDLYIHQQECEAREKREKYRETKTGEVETPIRGELEIPVMGAQYPNQGSKPAQSGDTYTPTRGSSNQRIPPAPLIAEPTILLTGHKNPPPPTSEKFWGRMEGVWKEVRKENLSKAGWKQVKALRVDEDTRVRAWAYWIETRNLDGLLHPLIMFVEEFPETLAALKEHNERQAAKAENAQQVEESAKTCAHWRENLEAFAKQSKSAVEIGHWVEANPAPPMLVQTDDGIAAVVYADSVVSMCKFMAEKRAEKDGQRKHDPENGFCACPACQPDFWKESDGGFLAAI